MSPSQARRKALWGWTLRLLVLALLAWGIRHTLVRAQHELRDFHWQVSWAWLVAAGAFYLAGLVPSAWYWHRVLVALGEPSRAAHTIRAHIFGQLGKYVPGKAMVFVLRIGALRPVPIRAVSAAIAIFYETLTFMAVGAWAATLILWAGYRQAGWLIGVSAGLAALTALPTWPPLFRRAVLFSRKVGRDPQAAAQAWRLGYRTMLEGWMANALAWLLLGLSFWATLRAMLPAEQAPLADLPFDTACLALAIVAGFVSLIPGGLGVRELVLLPLLAPRFGEATAMAAVVLLRLVFLLTELMLSTILWLFGLRSARGSREAATSPVSPPSQQGAAPIDPTH